MHLNMSVTESTDADGTIATQPSATLAPQGVHIYKLHGRGTDEYGTFVIVGFVWATGEVCFTKLYTESGRIWDYRGRLLPWGIAGTWHWDEGSFWIWKDGLENFGAHCN
jgi:hypothetical protein